MERALMKGTANGDLEHARGARPRCQSLQVFFKPQSVAVVGATDREGSVGRTILWNLISSPFGGTVFPINPKRSSVLGVKAYASVSACPEPPELAVIVTPATTVPGVIRECAGVGVKGAIIISAGFKEIGPVGVELERQVMQEAQRVNMRIIGPNCLGVMSPVEGLNATFASTMARAGNVGFISQSGALCTAILDWSLREMVGFSAFISIGSMLDVAWGDLIEYLGDDPNTRSIIIYMESIGDARSFLSAARLIALTKPIIVIKAGRSEAAAKAASSHTGALAGSDDVLDAAFRRSGVLRVNNISDLFYMTEALARQPRPHGPRLTILTNAGGPGVLATDAISTYGLEVAKLSDETMASLNQLLPPQWSHGNPIDVLGDADPDRYAKAVEIVARDPNNDGLLVVLTPQAMSAPTETAERLKPYAKLPGKPDKPILASWMGGTQVSEGELLLNKAGIPTFSYPDTAVRVFNYMWRYSYNLRGLYETPALVADTDRNAPDRLLAAEMVKSTERAGRTLMTEYESKRLLAAYRIPTVPTHMATSEEEASHLATATGYPVVLKLLSETITHKTDVGGVRLDLKNEDEVRAAYGAIEAAVLEKAGPGHFRGVTVQPMIRREGYELIIGSSPDVQFGPVLLFGLGGQLVEVFKDRALGLPPLNTTLARRMMEQTHIYKALGGVRGRKPVDLGALEELMVRFSHLVVDQRRIQEIDINPLLASPDGIVALDARVVLYPPEVGGDKIPRLPIRPYPIQYSSPWTLKSGTPVEIRPIRPEDEPLMVRFHTSLSERSVYMRYFHMLNLGRRIEHDRLTRVCFIDYDREMALVAEVNGPQAGQRSIIAVGRLSRMHGTDAAEVALVISDEYQRQGLGTELMRRLISVARAEKLTHLSAEVLAENREMLHVTQKTGFRLERGSDETTVRVSLDL